jgi:uncharacterized protein
MITTNSHRVPVSQSNLVVALAKSHSNETKGSPTVEIVETHISMIFLTPDYAYKVKKPIRNEFLDYSILANREHYCHEELRLDGRYSPGLYMDVVPFVRRDGSVFLGGKGEVCEYAVKMHRFPADALLGCRLDADQVCQT